MKSGMFIKKYRKIGFLKMKKKINKLSKNWKIKFLS